MYLLGLALLILSSWYLLKLYNNFNDDPLAKKEIESAWQEAKKEATNLYNDNQYHVKNNWNYRYFKGEKNEIT